MEHFSAHQKNNAPIQNTTQLSGQLFIETNPHNNWVLKVWHSRCKNPLSFRLTIKKAWVG